MKRLKLAMTYCTIIGIAFLSALNYELFVFPNRFAPSGLNGICTMIQHVWGIPVSYLSLIINIPLALIVYFLVSKPLAVRSMVYVVTFSAALMLLGKVDLSPFAYETENGTSTIMGPFIAGIIYGTGYTTMVKASAYSGGTDFIAAVIHKHHPEKSIFSLIFVLNAIVAVASYFVYDYQMEPVIMCIFYSFTASTVSDRMMKSGRSAVRFEIITEYPQEIGDAIIHRLHHSATLLPGKGMYLGKETNILICIVNKTQATVLSSILKSFPHTFAVVSQVGEVMGNFKHLNINGQPEKELLDHGDNQSV